jgi:lysophospholipase L1-like esterase
MMRAARPALRILGATIPGATGSAVAGHGSAAQEACRQAVNHFIRTGGVFDAVCDFAAVTSDPETGALLPLFKPDSTMGGLGDGLHPNRAGYAAMAAAIDLAALNL